MSAQRTLAAAQRLYEGSSNGAVITYPRTRSQFLPVRPDRDAEADRRRRWPACRPTGPTPSTSPALDVLPLARVVNDGKVDDHHAIIPTGDLPRGELSNDDRRVFDLICRRFLAVFHPDARFEDTEVVTEAGGDRFRTKGKRLLEAGWRGPAFGDEPRRGEKRRRGRAGAGAAARSTRASAARCATADVLEKQTKPPGRYTEASLLGAMETAGRTIDDEELREAMKEGGLGTPATRADTIERLLNVGYIEREGKALVATAKGRETIELLGNHTLTSAELTGTWEKRLSEIEHGAADRGAFMARHRQLHRAARRLLPRHPHRVARGLPERRRRRGREPLGLRLQLLQEQEGARAAGSRSGSRRPGSRSAATRCVSSWRRARWQ